jgi:hypothetical protein
VHKPLLGEPGQYIELGFAKRRPVGSRDGPEDIATFEPLALLAPTELPQW